MSSSHHPGSSGVIVLARGERGEDVTEVQRLLQWSGFQIAADGIFGTETEAAVEDFQAEAGLEVDGLVGPDTLGALRHHDTNPAAGSPDGAHVDRTGHGTASGQASTSPSPIAVETPGGGRITDRREPPPAVVVTIDGLGGKAIRLHRLAAAGWTALVAAARRDGIAAPLLSPVSGLRTLARQQELWNIALRKYGSEDQARKWVAKPGTSAHHSGRAVDCWLGTQTGQEHVAEQRATPAWRWLTDHAEDFGFYPYDREPWHWEYNPPAG